MAEKTRKSKGGLETELQLAREAAMRLCDVLTDFVEISHADRESFGPKTAVVLRAKGIHIAPQFIVKNLGDVIDSMGPLSSWMKSNKENVPATVRLLCLFQKVCYAVSDAEQSIPKAMRMHTPSGQSPLIKALSALIDPSHPLPPILDPVCFPLKDFPDLDEIKVLRSDIEAEFEKELATIEGTPNPPAKIILREQHRVPFVHGKEKRKLTLVQYKTIKALLDAGDNGLTKDELVEKSGHSDARGALRRLKNSDPDWEKVIHFPGLSGGRYRVK